VGAVVKPDPYADLKWWSQSALKVEPGKRASFTPTHFKRVFPEVKNEDELRILSYIARTGTALESDLKEFLWPTSANAAITRFVCNEHDCTRLLDRAKRKWHRGINDYLNIHGKPRQWTIREKLWFELNDLGLITEDGEGGVL
jgi:hypothetical protein